MEESKKKRKKSDDKMRVRTSDRSFIFVVYTKKKKKKRRTYNWTSSARKGANFLLGVTEEEPDCKHCTRWIDRRKENRYGFRQHNTYGEKLSTDRK